MSDYRRAATPGGCYFFTVVTHLRRELLATPEHVAVLRSVVREVRDVLPFQIDAWVILPDHMHCVWTLPPNDRDFSKRWGLIKAGFTRHVAAREESVQRTASRLRRREGTVWQRRFWEHEIRNEEDFRLHMDYTHYNPVKHGLVPVVKDWPHSTFHQCVRSGIYPVDWGGGVSRELEASARFGE